MRALYHEFIWKLRCGQIDCDMSGQEVTQGDRSGHFFVKFRLTVFRTWRRREVDEGAESDLCPGYGRRCESAQRGNGKVSRNETLRPFPSRFCDIKAPREDFQP